VSRADERRRPLFGVRRDAQLRVEDIATRPNLRSVKSQWSEEGIASRPTRT
jgi:hypothetical protein